ncbi:hypothetical protein [Heyndrickxia acidiproducens]|uniref:hypothetical protein n=1 Tax=Heyndrickxia acidiproducens TaxID=1121084 RepID=UPI0003771C7F|nr:hypothetical protein [Heyndrickxia acidiproducens]
MKWIGLLLIAIGFVLLPFGILQFKKAWKEYDSFSPKSKKIFGMMEIVDVLTGTPILSTWLMYISALCIVTGLVIFIV